MSRLEFQQGRLHREYKAIESAALVTIIGDQQLLAGLSCRQLVILASQNCKDLPANVKENAAKELTKSNNLRLRASTLWPPDTPATRGHLFRIDVINAIIELLKVPTDDKVEESHATEVIVANNPGREDDIYDNEELRLFLEELETIYNMVAELWRGVSEGTTSLSVANIGTCGPFVDTSSYSGTKLNSGKFYVQLHNLPYTFFQACIRGILRC